MTVGSLFAGIGGFDLGLERAGHVVKWQVENNPYCQRVLAKHWPGVTRYGDICGINWATVEPVDLLCGGFPCQDISNAGRREGIEGERSGLWKEFYRAIRALRPRYVLVENVSALRSRGLSTVLADLAEIRFDAEWHCIPASAVGAPHQRDRVWIVAYPQSSGRTRLANGSGWKASWIECPSEDVADADATGLQGREVLSECAREGLAWASGMADPLCGRHGAPEAPIRARWDSVKPSDWWLVEPNVGRVAHGVPKRVDRLRGLGNAVVPQVVEWIGGQLDV